MLSFFKNNRQQSIHVNALEGLLGQIELIDIREIYEYTTGNVPTAKNIPMGELLENPLAYLKKEKKYYIMCQSGMRSARATKALKAAGFDVVNVEGGMGAYKAKNMTY